MKSQLYLPSEFKGEETLLKSVDESKGGYVGTPDQIFTKNMLKASKELDSFSKEWRKKYDFHLAEFQVDINPNPDYNPEWVSIACSLNSWEPALSRPTVTKVFPSTEFVDANWKLEGDFGVSASLGFDRKPEFLKKFEAETKGEAKFTFHYNPKIARTDSGTSGSNFHWNFRKASGKFPVGGLELIAVIMRPRNVEQIMVYFEIAVMFDRRNLFWGDCLARATGESKVQFTPGPV